MNKDEVEVLDEKSLEKDRKLNNQKNTIMMLVGIIFLLLIIIAVILILPHFQKSEKAVRNSNSSEDKNIVRKENLTESEQKIINEKSKKISEFFSIYYPFDEVDEIPNQELLHFAERNISGAINGFSKKDVDSFLKSFFGDVSVKHENITCEMTENHPPIYLYDGEGRYTYNEAHGGHGICDITTYLKPISSEKIGNDIDASYRILYSVCCDVCGPTTEYYKKLPVNSNNLVLKLPVEQDGSVKPATEEQMNAAYEKAPITYFHYEIARNGELYLESVSYEKD